MGILPRSAKPAIAIAGLLLHLVPAALRAEEGPAGQANVVTYEAFGAVGDGKTDDLPSIRAAHDHANRNGLKVRSKPGATYHLGRRAITAVIATDTDWGTSRFIIDDSQGVENRSKPLFEVRSLLEKIPLKIDRLAKGQTRLDQKLPAECLVYVENKNRRIYIRRGLNQNDGSSQKEVFIARQDGSIEGAVDWDYETVTRAEALPMDPETLFIRGGIFTNIANRTKQEDRSSGYWARNIVVCRSKTVVDGVTHQVTGETEAGQPYAGFLSANKCARVVFRNCVVDGRKTYVKKAGSAGKPVSMGTYGYHGNLVADFRMIRCRMGNDIHDRSRWGVVASNFMKDILVEDCELSRVDVHMGVSGSYIIRRSTLGHAGINAIGRGRLVVEDSTIHARHLISFRDDYGSTWDGEVLIRNCRWLPPKGSRDSGTMFEMNNDGTHDFGYPCTMPRSVRIDGLFVDDSGPSGSHRDVMVFNDPIGPGRGERPFPYGLTAGLEIRGLKTASGQAPGISTNPLVVKSVVVVQR